MVIFISEIYLYTCITQNGGGLGEASQKWNIFLVLNTNGFAFEKDTEIYQSISLKRTKFSHKIQFFLDQNYKGRRFVFVIFNLFNNSNVSHVI